MTLPRQGGRRQAQVKAVLGSVIVMSLLPATAVAAVTRLNQGTGISLSPNPITSTGTISLALPLSVTDGLSASVFSVTNSSTGDALDATGPVGVSAKVNGSGKYAVVAKGGNGGAGVEALGGSSSGYGVLAIGSGTSQGVVGEGGTGGGIGVEGLGRGTNAIGVYGVGAGNASGVYARGGTSNGPGLTGVGTGTGPGVIGTSGSGSAGEFLTNGASNSQPSLIVRTAGTGRAATFSATNSSSTANVIRASSSTLGVIGNYPAAAVLNAGINNTNGVGPALYGSVNSIFGNAFTAGVAGEATGTGGYGVYAAHSNSSGYGWALLASNAGLGSTGQFDSTNTSNDQPTVYAQQQGTGPAATFTNTNSYPDQSIVQVNGTQNGTIGNAPASAGINATVNNTSAVAPAVYGNVNSEFGNAFTAGLAGESSGTGGYGVYAEHTDTTGYGMGLFAQTDGLGYGAQIAVNNGSNSNPALKVMTNGSGPSAQFDGGSGVQINGNLNVTGSISAGVKDFKIDDPADPTHKYLIHTSVESPQAENTYNGNITTDSRGYATVDLPSYFDAENIDPRYQLTVIGSFARAVVWKEEHNNQFVVRTDQPRMKVSWQVTAIRNDPYSQSQRGPAEQLKATADRGRYLYPAGFGKAATDTIGLRATPLPRLTRGSGRPAPNVAGRAPAARRPPIKRAGH
jgi:hypothetical protein